MLRQLISLLLLITFTTSAYAAPSGAVVTAGSASISTLGATTNITQSTDKAIINWQSFGIASNELVQFFQPGLSSVALNRVLGGDPSLILGALKANGAVWLLNPNGVLFGPGAQVNVGGVLASTLSLSDQNFLNGNYQFAQDPAKALSFVVNQGTIQTSDSGYVVMMAPLVDNEGMIAARVGQVKLEGATRTILNFDNEGFLNFVLSGNPTPQNVVILKDALSNLASQVVQNPNLVAAGRMVDNGDGTVTLGAAEGVAISGETISTNGAAGTKAGNVEINSTQATVLSNQSVIQANGAGTNSDGGNIKIYSQGNTLFAGTIQARGGDSGNGGFVETSGEKNLYSFGNVDTSAPNGTMGTWLLDPTSITITDASSGGSADGSLPTIGTGTTGTVDAGTLKTQSSNITITATNDIIINDLSASPISGNLALANNISLTLTSNSGSITMNNTADTITASGTGAIAMSATASGKTITVGNLTTGSGNISLTAASTVNVNKVLSSTSGTITVTSNSGAISGTSSTSLNAGTVTLSAHSGIGTSGTHLNTQTSNLSATNTTGTGQIYIDNTVTALSTLTVVDGGVPIYIKDGGAAALTNDTAFSMNLPGSTVSFTINCSQCTIGGDGTNDINFGSGSLTLITDDYPDGNIGTSSTHLKTTGTGSLNVTTSINGNNNLPNYIDNTGTLTSLTVHDNQGSAAEDYYITTSGGNFTYAGGTLTMNLPNTNVSFTENEGVLNNSGSSNSISAKSLTLSATGGGGGDRNQYSRLADHNDWSFIAYWRD